MKPLLFAALCLSPAAARAGATTDADPPTGSDADAASDGETAGESGVDTGTMPPAYEPCGCRADQTGPGWTALLAALGLCLRRRRAR